MTQHVRAVALVSIVLIALIAHASARSLDNMIEQEQQWVLSLPLPSGAIPMNRGHARLVPYFTNLGLLGLVDDPDHAETIRNWAKWYVNHLNQPDPWGLSGTVFDYELRYGQEQSTGDYDSSDSYAATFISLMRAYYAATNDANFLLEMEDALRLIASAMYGTLDPADNLTYAKPHYRIKYLMDNAEVYKGLVDWAAILRDVLGDEVTATHVAEQAESTRASVLGMWHHDRFHYAKDERGNFFASDWSRWYPDATAQLFPLWTGVLQPSDPMAQQLWSRFNEEHPQWVTHGHPDAFPWTVVGYVAALMEDWERVEAYVDVIHGRYSERGRVWPWYVGEAGWYLLTLKALAGRTPEGQPL